MSEDRPTLPEPLFERSELMKGGQNLTQGLFYEFRHQSPNSTPKYNYTREYELGGTIPMYKVYMQCASEYEAAVKLLGSWKHWLKLCECTWFEEELDKWREERLIQEKAIGKATLIKQAKDGNVNAAKTLEAQSFHKVGRPNKTEKQKAVENHQKVNDKVTSLLNRYNANH